MTSLYTLYIIAHLLFSSISCGAEVGGESGYYGSPSLQWNQSGDYTDFCYTSIMTVLELILKIPLFAHADAA